jgi:hypothetical protein
VHRSSPRDQNGEPVHAGFSRALVVDAKLHLVWKVVNQHIKFWNLVMDLD